MKDLYSKETMLPHEEGGYYAENYHREGAFSQIYYLLPAGESCRWHRIRHEEMWLFHRGGRLLLTLGGDGECPFEGETLTLDGDHPTLVVPENTWQKANAKDADVLVSCVTSPPFSKDDWSLWREEKK